MSTSTRACYSSAAKNLRKPSRKAISLPFLGSAAVGCLVLGSAWMVYANILAASVYPRLDSAKYDEPVVRPPSVVAIARTPPAGHQEATVLRSTAPARSPALSFFDRFAAAAPQSEPSRQALAPQPQGLAAPRLAEAARLEIAKPEIAKPEVLKPTDISKNVEPSKPKDTAPRSVPAQLAALTPPRSEPAPVKPPANSFREMAQRAKAAVMSIAGADRLSVAEKLWGKPTTRSLLAYASADTNITGSLGNSQNSALGGSEPRYDRSTAVYDISAHMVYLPDGSQLEAHSGLGDRLDDPSSASVRMRGVTPPHLYELTPREALFHGVPALRLTPVGGEDSIFGRSGLLAHTYMLGPNGDSNGCVSFRDYNAFLNAYRNQGIKRLAVVARIE